MLEGGPFARSRSEGDDAPCQNQAADKRGGTGTALFPPKDVRLAVGSWLNAALLEANDAVREGPVSKGLHASSFTEKCAEFDFKTPRDLQAVLAWVVEQMVDGVVHVNHPRYFGLFNPCPTFAAECAERIVASFNPQLATATTSPFPVALEAHLIKAIAERVGMPNSSGGHFTTGGSEANATALICALTQYEPGYSEHGVGAFSKKPVIYTSKDSHLAWLKIAHQTGIGRAAVRLIATDGTGRMSIQALEAHIAQDMERGCAPVMIASTAGTTGAGMIDPLRACGRLARQFGAWHHVDAAWGGALAFSETLRPLLDGIGEADSITIDAHKWLATTMGCGMFLTARPQILQPAFDVFMSCMPSNSAGLDPYITTLQWSRRFLGLRLFVGLTAAGWDGYAAHVEKSIGLAKYLEMRLLDRGWAVANDSPVGVLCLVPPSGADHAQRIAQAVVRDGRAWVSTVTFEGQVVLRFCVTSGEATEADIDQLVQCLTDYCQA